MYAFAKDLPPDPEAIAKRFAAMPDANLRMTLESALWLMERTPRDTWRIQAELAEAEIERRAIRSEAT